MAKWMDAQDSAQTWGEPMGCLHRPLSLRHYYLPKEEEITVLPPLSAKQMGNRPEGYLPGRFAGTEPGPHSTRATEQLAYWSSWSLADTEPGTVSW